MVAAMVINQHARPAQLSGTSHRRRSFAARGDLRPSREAIPLLRSRRAYLKAGGTIAPLPPLRVSRLFFFGGEGGGTSAATYVDSTALVECSIVKRRYNQALAEPQISCYGSSRRSCGETAWVFGDADVEKRYQLDVIGDHGHILQAKRVLVANFSELAFFIAY
nr:hypothetical protein Iba_chr05dCG8110 [Ipomoea batatas]